jgi:hypothetical protein
VERVPRGAALAALLLAALAGGCGTAPERPTRLPAALAGGGAVSVVDRGWHTDIALAASPTGPVAAVAARFPGARFLVFGFGDRDFYMSREESVLQTLAAMFPGPGVVLVTGLSAPPAEAFGAEHVVTLRVSCGELAKIETFLAAALARGADQQPQALDDGPYAGSEFYASSETYDLFHNCNRWTLAALANAGLPAEPAGVVFAGEAMAQARAIAAEPQRRAPPAPSGCAGTDRPGEG